MPPPLRTWERNRFPSGAKGAYQQQVLSDRLSGDAHDSGDVGMAELHPLSYFIHRLHGHTAHCSTISPCHPSIPHALSRMYYTRASCGKCTAAATDSSGVRDSYVRVAAVANNALLVCLLRLWGDCTRSKTAHMCFADSGVLAVSSSMMIQHNPFPTYTIQYMWGYISLQNGRGRRYLQARGVVQSCSSSPGAWRLSGWRHSPTAGCCSGSTAAAASWFSVCFC